MPGSVNNRNTPQYLSPRPGTGRDEDPSQIEKKPGKLEQLKTGLTSIKNRLTNTRAKSLSVISDRMSKEQTMQALGNIREQRRASLPAKSNKPQEKTVPTQTDPALQKKNEALAMRDSITAGLYAALKTDSGAAAFAREDVEQFSNSLSICLGLQHGEMDPLQFSKLAGMQSEIAPFLPADVADKFTQLMDATRQQLLSQFS